MVRAKTGRNAARNPYAHLRMPLTVDNVMQSRMVINPLRFLHICPASVGSAALILSNEKKAKKITKKPVWMKDHITIHQEGWAYVEGTTYPKTTTTHTIAAKKLYGRNGITNPRKQIDVFEMYEPCSWCELQWMEDFLLCEKGEAWKLVERGATELDGEIPICPSGGVVTTNCIGATGLLRIGEAALQIRGDAGEHQVPKNVKNAVATAWGGCNWTVMSYLTKSLND